MHERTVYGRSAFGFAPFENEPGRRYTLRIDMDALAKAESDDPDVSKSDAAEQLRRVVATVGKVGEPGEHIRCVISVQMLTEGWDANNVTNVMGLRAFGSQLLCEQVVGRGLRRMDYTVDPDTRMLTEEYVDIYGVPFSLIPFRGRRKDKPEPRDKPKNHVHAVEERSAFEMRFPVVESYAFALRRNQIRADVDAIEPLIMDASATPAAVFVQPQIGFNPDGHQLSSVFTYKEQNREAYHAEQHLQTIQFEIARQITQSLTEATEFNEDAGGPKMRHRARHALFPQVYALVEAYVARKVHFKGCHPCDLGLDVYARTVVERLLAAIEPDDASGEPPLLPVLSTYRATGTTADVNFKTTKPCFPTQHSHLNQVAADTDRWEQTAAFHLERAAAKGYVR